jgi:hypothetical protein
MDKPGLPSFSNTEYAFAYKSDKELKKSPLPFFVNGVWLVGAIGHTHHAPG